MILFLSSVFSRNLQAGDRVRLFEGYDMEPRWLNGKEELTGTCVTFIKGQKNSLLP